MKQLKTALPGVFLFEPECHGDARGHFMEVYNERTMRALGLTTRFVQDNESYTAQRGSLRGIHYQRAPHAQAKLVRVTRGAVLDLAIDLRKGSPTYLHWILEELSSENRRMLFLPRGFGHGFLTLSDGVVFSYKVDDFYAPECDRSLRWNDPALRIAWGAVREDLLSSKDAHAPLLRESDAPFIYGEV